MMWYCVIGQVIPGVSKNCNTPVLRIRQFQKSCGRKEYVQTCVSCYDMESVEEYGLCNGVYKHILRTIFSVTLRHTVCVYVCIYIYIYIYTHTHTHTHKFKA